MTTSTNVDTKLCLYVLLLSFKVFKPIKLKYHLSVNLLICLVGMYLYSISEKDNFSRLAIRKFITYFNYHAINRYFDILLDIGLIIPGIKHKTRQYYKLSNKAILIVKEIPENYNRVLYEFSNKYNVVL
jgi:hypothetical protein